MQLFDAGDQTEVGEKGLTLRYYGDYMHDHIIDTSRLLVHQWGTESERRNTIANGNADNEHRRV